ncbi:MAG: sigma 54-interacting transcriptional regulator [Candidatus Zixiibacteriota bacterium]
MEKESQGSPGFDWHAEETSQQRDTARFAGELDRALSIRSRTPAVRQAAERLREQWERLRRRLEGRAARFGDQYDRLSESIERLRRERDRLVALAELDARLGEAAGLDAVLSETLHCAERSIHCEGALVVLHDIAGQTRRAGSDRGRGRSWPPVVDRELAEIIAAGARNGRRIVIEGRPLGTGPRDRGRTAHWTAVAVAHEGEVYGAIIVGRTLAESGFAADDLDALDAIGRRLGKLLAGRVGVAARPALADSGRPEGFDQLWGSAPAFKKAIALGANFAFSDTPILIEGEPGTGRESLARAIHSRSQRGDRTFQVVKSADLPEEVVTRSLFGVNAPGPDGRLVERQGDLELADGGTVFLEELAALGPVSQVRLVRYLREGTFEREGDRTSRRANVRLIIATQTDVDRALADGRLRQDLYYLITVARISLPPLRERGGDIVELARRLAQSAARKSGKNIDGIDVAAAHHLAMGSFPGNVRQLAQIVERAVLLARGPLITIADLPDTLPGGGAPPATELITPSSAAATQAIKAAAAAGTRGDYRRYMAAKKAAVQAVERAFVETVLTAVGQNRAKAARHCGIHRAQWQRLARVLRHTATEKDGETARGGPESDNIDTQR